MQPVYLIALFAASAMAAPTAPYRVTSSPGSYFVTVVPTETEAERPQLEEADYLVDDLEEVADVESTVKITTVTTETHTFRSGTDDESVVILTTTDERVINKPESPLSSAKKAALQIATKKHDDSYRGCYFRIFCGLSRKFMLNPLKTQEIIAGEDMLL